MIKPLKNRAPGLSTVTATAAPAGRVKEKVVGDSRKNRVLKSLPLVFSASDRRSYTVMNRLHKVIEWSNTRKAPLFNVIIVVLFLVITPTTSLLLRTKMAEISFEQAATQSSISRLRQDVETAQTKLDTLEADLPAKAQTMGMVPQQGAITVDLSDYANKKKAEKAMLDAKKAQTQASSKNQKSQPKQQAHDSQQSKQQSKQQKPKDKEKH
ncbi:hypothetical protein HXT24_03080 [Gardnerella sp. DNF00354]|jgi:hypothetical protein|uniref:Uncharacterized protein n=4 Tax=Gardnerella vaginalis TaxID=2702 RepID=A0A2N6S917_GARVA|nr:hypothetical protein [Gardnerella vaginalis]CQB86699.1 Uncharacterised protein [Chlamydia trachomatis]EGL14435.1 hypothetical protein HMPREF9435_1204 [Gardnerella vaginalis 315-A]EIK76162.1 hypothetical protein CGSMWGv284V_01598 [Gardnerella vaginalis 284V]EIK80328.1 hypothetical protein CGSMWGv55152_04352 [Gardnerella vaginalis 55152]EIK80795.1 hypothetical protein CGSMWGv1400E_03855 [Gardnerella vaginalis 1400E]